MTQIHPSAVIDKNAQLADGVVIGPNCVIDAGVSIGDGTILEANVVINGNVAIGRNNQFFPNCVIGCCPQVLRLTPDTKIGGLSIGNRNVIREQATIHPGIHPDSLTRIGSDNFLMVSVHIGVATLGNLVATAIVSRIGLRRLVYFSFVLMSIGLGGAALAPSLPALFVAQICIGLSQGVSYPVLMGMSIQHVADANRTTAMGLHQAVYAIGMFSGPWLSGILADAMGIQPMFGITALACLLLSVLVARRLVE